MIKASLAVIVAASMFFGACSKEDKTETPSSTAPSVEVASTGLAVASPVGSAAVRPGAVTA